MLHLKNGQITEVTENKQAAVSLVVCDVVHLHGGGEACVRDPRRHKDLVFVDGDAKQGAGRLQGGQVLPLKLVGVVDAHSLHALPAQRESSGRLRRD